MIEKTIKDFLSKKLDVKVSAEIPNGEESFVVFEKTGGGEEEHLKYATIAIQSYAPSRHDAALLNEVVKSAMRKIDDELNEVCQCRLNSDYNFTDTSTKKHRYQAVYDLIYY